MKDGTIYTMKTVPNYHGKQITLGDVMETGQVEEQYFIPEEKLYYTDPTVTHSDETEQRLPKEDRQTWQYLKGAKNYCVQVQQVMNMYSQRVLFHDRSRR